MKSKILNVAQNENRLWFYLKVEWVLSFTIIGLISFWSDICGTATGARR